VNRANRRCYRDHCTSDRCSCPRRRAGCWRCVLDRGRRPALVAKFSRSPTPFEAIWRSCISTSSEPYRSHTLPIIRRSYDLVRCRTPSSTRRAGPRQCSWPLTADRGRTHRGSRITRAGSDRGSGRSCRPARERTGAGPMSTDESDVVRAPDLIEPVIGFRQWRMAADGLLSIACDERWHGTRLVARCLAGRHEEESSPVSMCSCGIYAWYGPCPRTASAPTRGYVAGAVVMWGAIELHGTGMRAQHCRVVALALPLSRCDKRSRVIDVAGHLGVPAVRHRDLPSRLVRTNTAVRNTIRGARSPRPPVRRNR
jgi:hypothetical protein